jgi:hypothetical protein
LKRGDEVKEKWKKEGGRNVRCREDIERRRYIIVKKGGKK